MPLTLLLALLHSTSVQRQSLGHGLEHSRDCLEVRLLRGAGAPRPQGVQDNVKAMVHGLDAPCSVLVGPLPLGALPLPRPEAVFLLRLRRQLGLGRVPVAELRFGTFSRLGCLLESLGLVLFELLLFPLSLLLARLLPLLELGRPRRVQLLHVGHDIRHGFRAAPDHAILQLLRLLLPSGRGPVVHALLAERRLRVEVVMEVGSAGPAVGLHLL
mmetsp:Transcript_96552/g.295364  ORF Transcript_96552/g.295364 Transcript_96552/m.295364 type:complete len:214 (-) Transcript_96552:393-1034(-)